MIIEKPRKIAQKKNKDKDGDAKASEFYARWIMTVTDPNYAFFKAVRAHQRLPQPQDDLLRDTVLDPKSGHEILEEIRSFRGKKISVHKGENNEKP